MKEHENIILIGMSGAGKSTLGVLLAKALGKSFVDTDLLIQQKAGKLLQTIIDEDGLLYFMQLEEQVVSEVDLRDCVIATGGSVVYSEKAMQSLKRNGTVVYLAVRNRVQRQAGSSFGVRGADPAVRDVWRYLPELYGMRY